MSFVQSITSEAMEGYFKSHLHTLWNNGYLRMSKTHILESLCIDGNFVVNIHRDSETKVDDGLVLFNVDLLGGGRLFRATMVTAADAVGGKVQIDELMFDSFAELTEYAPEGGYKKGEECKENTIPFCRYCKHHGHMIKMEKNGRVICPVLLGTQCQKCGHTGHTTTSCKLPDAPAFDEEAKGTEVDAETEVAEPSADDMSYARACAARDAAEPPGIGQVIDSEGASDEME
jgi:hypothetical protein